MEWLQKVLNLNAGRGQLFDENAVLTIRKEAGRQVTPENSTDERRYTIVPVITDCGTNPEDCSSSNAASLPASLSRDKQNTSPTNHNVISEALDNLVCGPTWTDEKEYHKRVAGTREVHNKLEKNRRAHLRECFEILKKQLPPCPDEKKSSNLSILHNALCYIQSLHRKEREFEHEMERLAREKISAQQKLAILKKELSTQWEHIDFSAMLPGNTGCSEAEIKEEQYSLSTSTATEEVFDRLPTQNDMEDDVDIDIMSDSDEVNKLNSNTSSLSSFAMPCSPLGESLVELYSSTNHKTSSNGPVSAYGVIIHRQECIK